ncbi:hypothetical protein [Leuconostoc mesenteroides]|uniref:hypothetical protein n=1 Tax=Leuconostoc mesenteroides TaxID=1245 RepID=UPI002181FFBC|nr:hypothetical protein [Leuconostoc mesenteroides]MCS8585584.1 hypothetical protein [Leuconostoc mesenteroides]
MDTTVLGKTIYKNYIKKIFDLLMATFLIIVLLPVLLVVYIILGLEFLVLESISIPKVLGPF